MKRFLKTSLMTAAVTAAMPLAALADVTVYGRAHVSVDMLDDGADYGEVSMSSNSSRLGFKAEKKTDSGISGIMQIEGEITYNQGDSLLSSRDTFAGLKGDFGMLRFGQYDSPFKAARSPANLFGDQVGDMRNLTRVGNGRFDERAPNTIHYQSKDFNGVGFNIAYSLHEGNYPNNSANPLATPPVPDKQDLKNTAVSTSVTFKRDALDTALAYESFAEDASRGKRNAIRVAAAYSLNNELKLVGFFQTVDHDDDTQDSDVIGAGAEYKLNKDTSVKGMVLSRSADPADSDSTMLTAGVERRLDRALRVYANYALVNNDDNVAITPWQQGRTTSVAGSAGENASALSLGMRFDF